MGGGPKDEIPLPYRRWNHRVEVVFDVGLEDVLTRGQVLSVLYEVWLLCLDHGARDDLWGKVVVGKVPVAGFGLKFY